MTRKSALFLRFARPYVRRRLRRAFSAVRVSGLESIEELLRQGPVILAPNHVAWWDAFLCVALDERLGGGGYCLMDAENLERLPFFAWTGAVPLDRKHPRRTLRDLDAACALLTGPGRFLIAFPQGQQRPAHLPLEFHRGIELLAERTGAPVVPIGLRYDFTEGPRPEIHISCGPAQLWNRRGVLALELEVAVGLQLAAIDAELLRSAGTRDNSAFVPLIGGASAPVLPPGTGALSRLARAGKS